MTRRQAMPDGVSVARALVMPSGLRIRSVTSIA
jgi:hypothetical protein